MKTKQVRARKVVQSATVPVTPPVSEPVAAKLATPVPDVVASVPEPVKIAAPLPQAIKKVLPPVSKKPSVAKPAPAASKPGMTMMADIKQPKPKAAAEKVQTMMTDFNDRAKAMFEKSTKAGEELTEFTKGNMEALAASAKTAAKGAESLGQEMADYGKKSFETASAAMKTLATVKSPTEMFQIQSDYAKTAFDSAVAEASKFSEAWLKLAGDVFQPISGRYALAAEKIKAAAL